MINKLKHINIGLPRKRYNIFQGVNTFKEVLLCVSKFFSKDYSNTKLIQSYESKFSKETSCKYGVSFALGRMGLYAILKALNIKEGDEVIIPAFTCSVVPNAIIYAGALPVYVDIDQKSFNIDVSKIECLINQNTKALYAQHTFGEICDIEALRNLANKYNLIIIEDSAHALGATINGEKVGSLGDVAFFSTDHSKMISTGIGGMVTTNDERLAIKIREIQSHSVDLPNSAVRKTLLLFVCEYLLLNPYVYWIGDLFYKIFYKLGFFFSYNDELIIDYSKTKLYPAKLPSPLAEIGISQLDNLEANISSRKERFDLIESIIGIQNKREASSSHLRYSFLIKDRNEFENRFISKFYLGTWFTSIAHGRDNDYDLIHYKLGSCPVAEMCAKHIVNFPTHFRISKKDLKNQLNTNIEWIRDNFIS